MVMEVSGNELQFRQKARIEKAGMKEVDKMQEEIKKENPAPPKPVVQ